MYTYFQRIHDIFIVLLLAYAIQTEACGWLNLDLFCSSERSFSELRLVKTYLRSTMAEERLSSLAIIFCNKDLRVNTEKVISNFAQSSARSVEFLF